MEQAKTAVATVEAPQAPIAAPTINASPLDLPAEVFAEGIKRRKTNRAALLGWVREALVEGVDWGRIHVVSRSKCPHGNQCMNENHWSKPSLFKAGAEKICSMLGIKVRFPALSEYEEKILGGQVPETIMLRCELLDGAGSVVAFGVGARQVKSDYGDINKSLKMAEKSAHIDATLRLASLSEIFTQDLEDRDPALEASVTPRGADWDLLIAEATTSKELAGIRKDLEAEWRRIGAIWKKKADDLTGSDGDAGTSFADKVRSSKK